MKPRLLSCLLLLSLFGTAGSVWAQGSWHDLPADERQQMRQQMREHWQQGREAGRADGGRRWQAVPVEDRQRLRDDMREQRGRQEFREGRGERGGRRD
jgi:hypothetical protein